MEEFALPAEHMAWSCGSHMRDGRTGSNADVQVNQWGESAFVH